MFYNHQKLQQKAKKKKNIKKHRKTKKKAKKYKNKQTNTQTNKRMFFSKGQHTLKSAIILLNISFNWMFLFFHTFLVALPKKDHSGIMVNCFAMIGTIAVQSFYISSFKEFCIWRYKMKGKKAIQPQIPIVRSEEHRYQFLSRNVAKSYFQKNSKKLKCAQKKYPYHTTKSVLFVCYFYGIAAIALFVGIPHCVRIFCFCLCVCLFFFYICFFITQIRKYIFCIIVPFSFCMHVI